MSDPHATCVPEKVRTTSNAAPFLHLQLLGKFVLTDLRTNQVVTVSSKRLKALLAFLALETNFSASRTQIAHLLWPDSALNQARQSLRQLLSDSRRKKAETLPILFDDQMVRLDMSRLTIDVLPFLKAPVTLSLEELEEIASIQCGPFGKDIELGDSGFDEWLGSERRRLNLWMISLLDRYVRKLADAKRHDEALSQAMALLSLDPLREETHRLVIWQESIVSGRASAMQRYEVFRLLLRDELAVRPEPATLAMIDLLRGSRSLVKPESSIEPQIETLAIADRVEPRNLVSNAEITPKPNLSWRLHNRASLTVILTTAMSIIGIGIGIGFAGHYNGATYLGEDNGKLSIAILPFRFDSTGKHLDALSKSLGNETRLAFARSNRLSLVDATDTAAGNIASLGRQLRARYLVATSVTGTNGNVTANLTLFDSSTSESIWSASLDASDRPSIKFAREFYGFVLSEVTLHQARRLSQDNMNSVPAMLWRAEAAQIQTRIGREDPEAARLYRAVLDKDPGQFFALVGLSESLILKIARNQSLNKAADLAKATELVMLAKQQAPNSSDIAFKEAMLNKLQGNFAQAAIDFERTMKLDPTHWYAIAQFAHVKIFMGQFEEAYALMQTVSKYLLPDLRAAETAYIAGETALVAGQSTEAVKYLAMAVNGNPTVGRIQALYAAALYSNGQELAASQAATKAAALSPSYTSEAMALRGGPQANSRYIEARNKYIEAFRAARGAADLSN